MKKGDYQTVSKAKDYNYNRFAGGLSLVDQDEQIILANWLEKLKIKQPVVIDLASGTGRIIKTLLKYTNKIIALDASKFMLNELRKNYSFDIKQGKIKLLIGYSNKTKLKANSVDCITMFHLVKHLEEIDPTLSECTRILKKDGILIFDALNKNSIVSLRLETCFSYTLADLEKLLTNHGFKLIDYRYIHFLGESVYRILPAKLWHSIDGFLTKLNLPFATKIMILGQKK